MLYVKFIAESVDNNDYSEIHLQIPLEMHIHNSCVCNLLYSSLKQAHSNTFHLKYTKRFSFKQNHTEYAHHKMIT